MRGVGLGVTLIPFHRVLAAIEETIRNLRPRWPILGTVPAPVDDLALIQAVVAQMTTEIDDLAAITAGGGWWLVSRSHCQRSPTHFYSPSIAEQLKLETAPDAAAAAPPAP